MKKLFFVVSLFILSCGSSNVGATSEYVNLDKANRSTMSRRNLMTLVPYCINQIDQRPMGSYYDTCVSRVYCPLSECFRCEIWLSHTPGQPICPQH